MKLRQITAADSQTGENPAMKTLAISAMEASAPVLTLLEFRGIQGNAFTDKEDHENNGAGEMRAVNNDYTQAVTATPEVTATLKIYGDKVATDQAFVRRFPGQTIGDERARQLEKYCRSLGRGFTDRFVNGDGTGNNITGLKTLCTGGQLLAMGANGANVSLGSDNTAKKEQQAFLAKIDELLASVPGALFLMMDAKTRARLKAIAREYLTVSVIQDAFGQNQELAFYNGVQIVTAGYASDNSTLILPHTETKGTATNVCTSIYVVTPAEDASLAMITSTGLSVKDLGIVGQQYVTNVELDVNTMLYNVRAVGRLEGIIIN